MTDTSSEIRSQREYYESTAHEYDAKHLANEEHNLAMELLWSYCRHYKIRSVLDAGAGTGRLHRFFQNVAPDISVCGIEPSQALRTVGHQAGIPESDLVEGDIQQIGFDDKSFELVTAFGVLHHVPNPTRAVDEMLRVSSKAVFISDANLFGQGTLYKRIAKSTLRLLGLWKVAVFLKTKGRGYHISQGDGLAYPYSIFVHFDQLGRKAKRIHIATLETASLNVRFGSGHACVMAVKDLNSP